MYLVLPDFSINFSPVGDSLSRVFLTVVPEYSLSSSLGSSSSSRHQRGPWAQNNLTVNVYVLSNTWFVNRVLHRSIELSFLTG